MVDKKSEWRTYEIRRNADCTRQMMCESGANDDVVREESLALVHDFPARTFEEATTYMAGWEAAEDHYSVGMCERRFDDDAQ